jgi:hypothetical protein
MGYGTIGDGVIKMDPVGNYVVNGNKTDPTPQANIPKFAMRKTSDFMMPQANIQIGGPSENALTRKYNALKESAGNRINASESGAADAIKRKFASQGASGSGAEVSALMQSQNQFSQQKNEAIGGLDSEQAGTQFQTEAQRGLAQADLDFKNRVFTFDSASKMHELDLAERQAQTDSAIQEFNGQVAAQAGKPQKKGVIGSILGGIF